MFGENRFEYFTLRESASMNEMVTRSILGSAWSGIIAFLPNNGLFSMVDTYTAALLFSVSFKNKVTTMKPRICTESFE